jgi:hypothetical protein
MPLKRLKKKDFKYQQMPTLGYISKWLREQVKMCETHLRDHHIKYKAKRDAEKMGAKDVKEEAESDTFPHCLYQLFYRSSFPRGL